MVTTLWENIDVDRLRWQLEQQGYPRYGWDYTVELTRDEAACLLHIFGREAELLNEIARLRRQMDEG